MKPEFDAIVVGAGPAGGACAYSLAKQGRSVLLIERGKYPGAKNVWGGALYGLSSNSRWTAFRRPHNRAENIQRLYFAGGTTHPGGGVPMVTLSGKVAAGLILADLE